MNIRAQIPNLFTAANAALGILAIIAVFQNRYDWALVLFLIALLCDFLDGMLARSLGVSSELGVQLDSMADIITSGVLPGLMVYQFVRSQSDEYWEFTAALFQHQETLLSVSQAGAMGIVLSLGAAYRLARFNIDTEQTHYFKGLATPAMALFFMGYSFLIANPLLAPLRGLLSQPYVMVFWVLFFVFLMNSTLRMFKVKLKTNYDKIYIGLLSLGSLLLFVVFGFAAFSLAVILYLLLCLIRNVTL